MKEIKICLIKKLFASLKTIFWVNPNILYINSNVKQVNVEKIKLRGLNISSRSKIIECQTAKKNSLFSYKKHLAKMKFNLFQITRNTKDCDSITYAGFPSQMFAVYDGYVLGETHSYKLIGYNQKYYDINFKVNHNKRNVNVPKGKEVNLLVVTSYKINKKKCKNLPTYLIDIPEPNKFDNKFLNEVRSAVKNFLDSCGESNIKQINLYITGKVPVCFAVGTAIERFHPNIKIYEYVENEFKYYFDLQNEKLGEVRNG